MQIYQTKECKLSGSTYAEVKKQAFLLYFRIKRKSKRKTYVRSAYFKKEKIFLNLFWSHMFEKNPRQRFNRLKYFPAAIDLIQNSRNHPSVKQNPNNKEEVFYRFFGYTQEKQLFCVQIKTNIHQRKKYLISCFPVK
ncbi:hypothetical protein KKC88_01345 [Patescibacteria group bacterium]|nr:hypothetical protein [Patescibacteria group bacterium]MBU1673472.1 hypothetical protein [Patescibacteria group bacterium]